MNIVSISKGVLRRIHSIKAFQDDRKEYILQHKRNNCKMFKYQKCNEWPFYMDRYQEAGTLDSHYFLQDLHIAREIYNTHPEMHYDIGSRLDGFIAHLLSAEISVTMIDVRPLPIEIPNLHFVQSDATKMDGICANSIKSLSSLHAIEHFGLGRYGDKVDVDGWKKALHEYERILAPGGILYLGVPIGPENKLVFNAHRIFYPKTIADEVKGLQLLSFCYIKDFQIFYDKPENYKEREDYLCGLFTFSKL